MPKPADDPIDMKLSVGFEHHFQKNFAFELQLPSFLGVDRIRLKENFDLRGGRAAIDLMRFAGILRNFLLTKSASGNSRAAAVAPAVPIAANRHAVSEPGTGDRAFDSA